MGATTLRRGENALAGAGLPYATGRHRGRHRDPVGAFLAGLWAIGNLAAISLIGVTAHDQLTGRHVVAATADDVAAPAPGARQA